MTAQRSFKTILTFLFLTLSAGLILAQNQSSPPAYDPGQAAYGQSQAAYGQDQGGYGQDQSGLPAPPPPQANGAPQQGYPGQPDQAGQQLNPPGRVARLQYMDGQVSMQPGGVNDWIAASENRPLTTSDRIWTDKNSRAELNVGDGFIRMNSETSVTLTNVSDNTVQLELDQGTLDITVRHLEPGEVYEVDTPNYAFTVMKAGVYRFDVYPSEDQSWVTVRKGYGEATGRGPAVRVNSGEQMRFTSGNSLQHTAEAAPARDGFDDWAQVRDKRLEDSQSARYVSPGVIGYQDLDAYGRWVPTPSYGTVWVPAVAPGWAPYRFGHWAWIPPWGWTWVDDAPWGFAPFHYGRWVYWGGAWAWAPGPVGYWNPYYAPALVGWIGGPGFGIGFGFPGFSIGINFGWFPLGWGEPFYPRYAGWGYGGWYHGGGWVSNTYIRNVNITNTHITNITNVTNNYYSGNVGATHYGFRSTPGAVTAAPGSAFTSGAAINRVGGAVPASQLGKGTVLSGVNVNPTKQSVLGGNAPQTRGVPPASAFSRSVVTANKPPAVARPANLESANAATVAHGNLNALNTSGSVANGARPGTTASNAGRVNGTTNGRTNPAGTSAATQSRQPASAGNEARLDTTPTSQGGHYVPRPPSAGGIANSTTRSGATNSTSPANGSRSNAGSSAYGQSANGYGHTNGTTKNSTENRTPTPNNTQRYGLTTSPTVPRPTPSNEPSRQSTAPQRSTPPPSHQSSGSKEKESSHSESGHGPGASLSSPHPASRNSATYSASASYGSRPFNGSSGGNSRGSYGTTSATSLPYFGNRSYGSTAASSSHRKSPAYSSRSYGSSPTYLSRSMGAYSAPRTSSAASAYHATGGASRGGASHSGGGGHGR